MKNITIIISVISACIAGYLFRMVVENFKKEEIIVSKSFRFSMVPNYIWATLGCSIFCFVVSVLMLLFSFEGPS